MELISKDKRTETERKEHQLGNAKLGMACRMSSEAFINMAERGLLDADTVMNNIDCFPKWNNKETHLYKVGEMCSYRDYVWRCIQEHIGADPYTPELTPDYWTKNIPTSQSTLLDLVYPVGSVYISRDATDPATLFGGTWVRIKDRFIWGIGDTDTVGATGGAKTHTLADGELPFSHIWMSSNTPATTGDNTGPYYTVAGVKTGPSKQAFSLMPPYIGMYMWERTA